MRALPCVMVMVMAGTAAADTPSERPPQPSLAGQVIFGMIVGTAGAGLATIVAATTTRDETAALTAYGLGATLATGGVVYIVSQEETATSSAAATFAGAAAGALGALTVYGLTEAGYLGGSQGDPGGLVLVSAIVLPTAGAIIGSRATRRWTADRVTVGVNITDDATLVGLAGRF